METTSVPGQRLDTALLSRGLARSRTHAARLIAAGHVEVAGRTAHKSAASVDDATLIEVGGADNWASRGAYKLLGALNAFDVCITDRRVLDAGASHGGFTDVLLHRGARSIAALDVGEGQLIERLRTDSRVHTFDRTNVRALPGETIAAITAALGGRPELVVADLSFISLTLVLSALRACVADGADALPMVKPQFEVGRGHLGSGGVVRDAQLRADAVTHVACQAQNGGWDLVAVAPSPLPGPSGNVEYFLHLRASPLAHAAAHTTGPDPVSELETDIDRDSDSDTGLDFETDTDTGIEQRTRALVEAAMKEEP